jgi:membrane-associated phospholipid phosphatase
MSTVPGPVTAGVVAALSIVVILTSYWLAVQPGAAAVQAGFMKWINDPPPPLGTVLAVTNSLFRPAPLTVIAVTLFRWMMFTARGNSRWEVLRAMVISFALAEVVAQILKQTAAQARPTAPIPGLDVHGYPKDPYGNAYPSAHTSVVVALVAALWPWLT